MGYPESVTYFTPVNNQPGTNDLGSAANMNSMNVEIDAIEDTLGVTPYNNLPFTTLNQALYFLYTQKSPLVHTHNHEATVNPNTPDSQHSLYVPIDGSEGFTGPQDSPSPTKAAHLINLDTAEGAGYTTTYPETPAVAPNSVRGFVVDNYGFSGTGNFVATVGEYYAWKITGGTHYVATNTSGYVYIPFQPGVFINRIQTILITPIPVANGYDWTIDTLSVSAIWKSGFNVFLESQDGILSKNIGFTYFVMGS